MSTISSATLSRPAGGGPSEPPLPERERLAATLLARLLATSSRPLPSVCVPSTGKVTGTIPAARHTEPGSQFRTLAELWAKEGEEPSFAGPSSLTDLQVWHRGQLHLFTGEAAARRLTTLAPTVFCEEVGGRRGAVAQAYVGKRLGFRITGTSLARSYAGAAGMVPRDTKRLADSMLHPQWRPRKVTGQSKNTRFFDCVTSVFVYFRLLEQRYQKKWYTDLGCLLVQDMLRWGRCRTALTTTYLDSLEIVLHGRKSARHKFHLALLSLTKEERAVLWKTRRLFAKDDNDPILNATQAMERMTVPRMRSPQMERLALEVIENFQRRAAAYVAENLEALRSHHDTASLHRSAATTFFTRALGGGAAEMHLTVGLYRLAQGKPSALQDVWGFTPEELSMDDFLVTMNAQGDIRKEIEAACSWMLDELERREISYPYLCIYPAREVKSRCFMLLPYALQQGGYQAATTVSRYLRNREDTKEVFHGFDDNDWLCRLKKDLEGGATHFLSLDSQVATDPLPHELCRKVFAPFDPAFSDFTRKAVSKTFGRTRVHVANARPKDFLRTLAYTETVMSRLPVRVREIVPPPRGDVITTWPRVRVHKDGCPEGLRTYNMRREIVEAIKTYGRVILKAPTGSGKTVLVSTFFNSIVQFPSVASLDVMSKHLTDIGKPHNVWHARCKSDPLEWDYEANEPHTILCTSYFVRGLSQQFPGMVVALDEAETKQENFLINLEYTRHRKVKTLLMSATPDELRGEDSTAKLELPGGTNFPVTRHTCTYTEMQDMLRDPSTPPALVCVHSEPLAEKLTALVRNANRTAFSLTARVRSQENYLEKLTGVDVILGTNAIRSSVTLPDVEIVFDLTRLYESIDFPLSGLESLVLTEVSEAMELQCVGRVGRVKPGAYYRIVDPPGSAIPYTPAFNARVPEIAAACDRIPPDCYSRELNTGSILVERFSRKLAACAGVRKEPHCPLWASVVRQIAPHQSARLLATVAFEALGMVNRTRQVATDLEMKGPYEDFQREAPQDYHLAARALLRRLQLEGWFPAEIAQIARWTEDLSNEEGPLESAGNQRACALALWRQVAIAQAGMLVGKYRNFSCGTPKGARLGSSGACLVLGLSLHNNAVTARWTLPLSAETVDWLDTLMRQVEEVDVVEGVLGKSVPAVLGWDVALKNHGRQTRRLHLTYDAYTRAHVFQPDDLERIWGNMKRVLEQVRHSEDAFTTQGSPMSATASFTVLNSFGLAAHDWVRDCYTEGNSDLMRGAGIFGDDDVRFASESALRAGTEARESLGLETKWSATGTAHIAEGGKLLGVEDQIGVFTERLVDFESLSIIPSIKPAGLIRLFQSENPDALVLSTRSYRSDMVSYEKQLKSTDARWAGTILRKNPDLGPVARRETAPRRILSRLFKGRVTPFERVATGDVDRLFDSLELMLLQVCPSTKGSPDRTVEEVGEGLGHPIMSLRDAKWLSQYLQGDDCYFKLHGPPLQFTPGPWAHEVVTRRNPHLARLDVGELTRLMSLQGWSRDKPPPPATPDEPGPLLPLDPIEYGDSYD